MAQSSKTSNFVNPVLSLLAGAALTLAFAPYDLWIVAVVSLAVLFYLWRKSAPKAAFILGYLYGLGMFGVGVHWLHISINLFGGVNIAGTYVLTYTLVAFLALYPALAGYISRKYFSENETLCLLLAFPTVWVLSEWCRSWIFTGFPWLNLGYSQTDTWLAGWAPLTGIYGISWLVTFCAALLTYLFVTKIRQQLIAAAALVFIFAVSFFINEIQWTTPDAKTKTVTLVQAAIAQELKWSPRLQQHTIDLYTTLSKPYWGSDLILWPETAIPMFYHQATSLIEILQSQATTHRTDFMSGFPIRDSANGKYYNGIITLGSRQDIYYKRHLVPFGEYLPLDRWLRPLLDSLGIPMSSFSAGTDKPLLHAAGVPIGVSICYEDVFGEETIDALPEARLLINVSNDAWFGDSIAPHQHLQMARMRARETGRYLLRATNTGISAIIDDSGRIVDQSPQFTPHALHGTIHTFTGNTPYAIYGNYLIVMLNILALIAGLALNIRHKKLIG